MALGRQAKVLSENQTRAVLAYLTTTSSPIRNRAVFLLSIKAGLRAKEIAALKWSMVTDADGEIDHVIALQDIASKGRSGGVLPMNADLRKALIDLHAATRHNACEDHVIQTARSRHTSAQVIVNTMRDWYQKLGFKGCSSHSGRRTFITNAARKISSVGGSMRDVQALARHSSLAMTQRYIDVDSEAQRKVVELV
jgi:integrase